MVKKFDYRQLLLQHGERIGIGIAAVVTLLFVALFFPKLFAGSPNQKAQELTTVSTWVTARLDDPNNLPTDADKPPPDADKAIKEFVQKDKPLISGLAFRVPPLSPEVFGGDMGRRQPTVLNIDEAIAKVYHIPVRGYIFDADLRNIYGLKIDGASGGQGERSRLGGAFGGPAGGPGGRRGGAPPMGSGDGLGGGGMPGMPATEMAKKDHSLVPIPLTKVGESTYPLAVRVWPLRMTVIAASFPFKDQVEEFRTKLALRHPNQVLNEPAFQDPKEKEKTGTVTEQQPPLNSFRFEGVEVQRREIDADGKPRTEWKRLDFARDYAPWLVRTGTIFEDDKAQYEGVSFEGLVMPRLRQFRESEDGEGGSGLALGGPGMGGPSPGGPSPGGAGGTPDGVGGGGTATDRPRIKEEEKYDDIEARLTKLAQTLEDLKGKKPTEVATPSRFSGDNFNPFARRPALPAGGEGGAGTGRDDVGGGGAKLRGPGSPRPGVGGTPEGGIETMQPVELPKHCLVRVIDVTVEPGKRYEYRMKIRMGNPNKDRDDTSNPDYRTGKEIMSSEWSKVPIRVAVPPELHYYLVDQETLFKPEPTKKRYDGPRLPIYNRDRGVVMQAHRWLQTAKMQRGPLLHVGEWSVAERFVVNRGEYIGRPVRVEVPVWRSTSKSVVIASDTTTKTRTPGIEVDFGAGGPPNQPEALLVDFTNASQGIERVVSRSEDEKPAVKRVTDQFGGEALVLRPDGKLVLREGAIDAADEGREHKLDEVKKRIEAVKSNKAKDGKRPFGEGPGGSGT